MWRNVLVMYDQETDSLWSQLTGECIAGRLAGKALKITHAVHTTWKNWYEQFPETKVLSKGRTPERNFANDPMRSYYYSSQEGVRPQEREDNWLAG